MREPERFDAVVLGDLNLVRAVGLAGLKVAVVSVKPDYIAFESRHCVRREVVPNLLSDPEAVVAKLVAIGVEAGEKTSLFYEDDHSLALASRARERLSPHYRYLMPPKPMIEAMVDKVGFTRLTRERDLPVPATVLAEEVSGVDEIVAKVGLPCVLKPAVRKAWFSSEVIRDLGGTPQKVVFANTRADLDALYPKMVAHDPHFLVQRAIPGSDEEIFSYHAYWDAGARPLGEFVGRKVRTYPPGSGISTYLRLVKHDGVIDLGRRIAERLEFVGVVKMDFKRHPETGRFHLMEINPRFNLWHYLGAVAGINLPRLAHLDGLGRPESVLGRDYRTDLHWLAFRNDLRTMLHSRRDGSLSPLSWLWSYRKRKVCEVFSFSDARPWWTIQKRRVRRLLGRPAVYSTPT